MNDRDRLLRLLAAPFPADVIEWKPQSVTKDGSRALAIAYVDARAVMNRLDQVLGLGNWQTSYRELADGVVCRLRVRVGGEWAEHEDVGSYSDQPDKGDKLKAAFSDSLKRCAVRFGVGRYLYDLPSSWCAYNKVTKKFTEVPQLPDWALPRAEPEPAPAPAKRPDPKTGPEFSRYLDQADAWAAQKGLAAEGATFLHICAQVERVDRKAKGVPPEKWTPAQVALGKGLVRDRLAELVADRKRSEATRVKGPTLARIAELVRQTEYGEADQAILLEQYQVMRFADLSEAQAQEVVRTLEGLATQAAAVAQREPGEEAE